MATKKPGSPGVNVRSSITGKYVKPEEAVKHPRTTETEARKPPKKHK